MMLFCAENNYKGFAHWMFVQVYEEDFHGSKLHNFLVDRGGKVQLRAIEAPHHDFKSLVDIFERTLNHEQLVTSKIHALFEIARDEKDYAAESFLKWYIDEQVEEEASAGEVLAKLKMTENQQGLMMLDSELATRVPGPELGLYLARLTGGGAQA
jgi:ferritin